MANTLSVMANALRNVVSKQRIRYTANGFNLDLSYICDNIIAMGYPAPDKLEGFYRNRLEDVLKFLEENHQNHYRIYNLCMERSYDTSNFFGRVATYPFEDHNPPTIELIQRFCADVDTWLRANRYNVVAVHCKAGKGRTGTMICCYLIYSGLQRSAEDALAWYDEKRTKDRKGVTIPSQRRYVHYFFKLISSGLPYRRKKLWAYEIRFSEDGILQAHGAISCTLSVIENCDSAMNIQCLRTWQIDINKTSTVDCSLYLVGDVKVELTQKSPKKNLLHFWFNTYFVDILAEKEIDGEATKLVYTLNKSEMDVAHKDKGNKWVSDNFRIGIVFKDESVCDIKNAGKRCQLLPAASNSFMPPVGNMFKEENKCDTQVNSADKSCQLLPAISDSCMTPVKKHGLPSHI